MKKHYLLFLVFLLTNISIVRAWQGAGTSPNPYLLQSKEDLAQLAIDVNAGQTYAGIYFELTADIDLQSTEWTPIGNDTNPFKGIFDGKSHVVKNLLITSSGSVNGVGLFGGIESGTLVNLGIKDANVTNSMQNVGVLVGVLKGNPLSKIENCFVDGGSLTMTGSVGQYGLLVGRTFNGVINNCYVVNSQLTTTNQTAGGFAGSINGAAGTTFSNCYIASITISGNKAGTLQGVFCGTTNANHSATFNNCYAAQINGYNYIGSVNNKQVYKTGSESLTVNQLTDLVDKLYLANAIFTNPGFAWKLNTINSTVINSGFWSHNGSNPVFADIDHVAVYKAGMIYNMGAEGIQTYTTSVLPASYTAIDLRNNSDVPNYTTLNDLVSQGSLNKLIYLPSDAADIPVSWKNVIKGSTGAATGILELTDHAPFFCPEEFIATKASYLRSCYTDGGWETMILPFTVNSVIDAESSTSIAENYVIEEYSTNNSSGSTTFFFNPIDISQPEICVAETPYIMRYTGTQNTGSNQDCIFEGQGKIAVTTSISEIAFKGTYQSISGTGKYLLAPDGTYFGKGGEEATIPPFRAYIELSNPNEAPLRFSVEHENSGATGINSSTEQNFIYSADEAIIIKTNKKQVVTIHSIDGQQVHKSMLTEGINTIKGLAKGIYIVNKQKIIIK